MVVAFDLGAEESDSRSALCEILLISYLAPSSSAPKNRGCSVVAISQSHDHAFSPDTAEVVEVKLTFQSFCALLTTENSVPVAPNMTVNRPISSALVSSA